MGFFGGKMLVRRREKMTFGLIPHNIFLVSGTLKHCESRTLHKVPQILELLAGMELFVVVLYKQ